AATRRIGATEDDGAAVALGAARPLPGRRGWREEPPRAADSAAHGRRLVRAVLRPPLPDGLARPANGFGDLIPSVPGGTRRDDRLTLHRIEVARECCCGPQHLQRIGGLVGRQPLPAAPC